MAEATFYLCAYEFAIKTENSPWCQLFDEIDAQVLYPTTCFVYGEKCEYITLGNC